MHLFGYGKKGKEFAILKDLRGVYKPGEMVLGSGPSWFWMYDVSQGHRKSAVRLH